MILLFHNAWTLVTPSISTLEKEFICGAKTQSTDITSGLKMGICSQMYWYFFFLGRET